MLMINWSDLLLNIWCKEETGQLRSLLSGLGPPLLPSDMVVSNQPSMEFSSIISSAMKLILFVVIYRRKCWRLMIQYFFL